MFGSKPGSRSNKRVNAKAVKQIEKRAAQHRPAGQAWRSPEDKHERNMYRGGGRGR